MTEAIQVKPSLSDRAEAVIKGLEYRAETASRHSADASWDIDSGVWMIRDLLSRIKECEAALTRISNGCARPADVASDALEAK